MLRKEIVYDYNSPTGHACIRGHMRMIVLLTPYVKGLRFNDDECMHAASINGHTDIVKYLFKHGCAFNNLNIYRKIVEHGYVDIVKAIIESGFRGDTLMYALHRLKLKMFLTILPTASQEDLIRSLDFCEWMNVYLYTEYSGRRSIVRKMISYIHRLINY
jgi:ankyrin repeat protein